MYNFIVSLMVSLPPQVPPVIETIPPQAPPIVVGPVRNSYMAAAHRAVDENRLLYVYIGKDAVHVPGAITGSFQGDFLGIKGPALVIAEPDGKGWLQIREVRYDAPASPKVFQRPVQQQVFRSSGRSSGSC